MQRYKVRCHDCDPEITPHENGKWVRWGDVERLRAESQARLNAIEYLLNTGIFAGNDAEDAQQHAMSIIDTARKGEGE
jgi:hypothetical protein